jgi:hypothetical protein
MKTTRSVSSTSNLPEEKNLNQLVVDELEPAVGNAETDTPIQQSGDDEVAPVATDCFGAVKDVGPGDGREMFFEFAEMAGGKDGEDVFACFVAAGPDVGGMWTW